VLHLNNLEDHFGLKETALSATRQELGASWTLQNMDLPIRYNTWAVNEGQGKSRVKVRALSLQDYPGREKRG
jgi:hypothetical protein